MTGLPAEEHILFQQIAEGDETAFNSLFDLFLPRLYPFIIKMTKSEGAAQEIIQETFMRVWMNRDKLPAIENPGGWLFRVASNECYSYLRKEATKGSFITGGLNDKDIAGGPAHERFDLKELTKLIHLAIEQLPAQRKKIYRMSRENGMTIPEIAATLGLSVSTVKNSLVSALKSIREFLVRYGIVFMCVPLFCIS